jgi:hypothetical protein
MIWKNHFLDFRPPYFPLCMENLSFRFFVFNMRYEIVGLNFSSILGDDATQNGIKLLGI